jgi:transposase, IS30 family
MSYQHLTISEREILSQMQFSGATQKEMAKRLNRNPGTISRELKRNGSIDSYLPTVAQSSAEVRRCARPLILKMDKPELKAWVTTGLTKFWSPEQISGRLTLQSAAKSHPQISRGTIYRWLDGTSEEAIRLRKTLRHGRYRPRHQGPKGSLIPNRRPLSERPLEASTKERIGDWEGDTVVGAKHRGAIATLVERKTGYLVAGKMPDGKSISLNMAVKRVFGNVPHEYRKTLALDNGVEFAKHESLAKSLGIAIYFARPYHSNARAINENTNGLLRQYFPKGTDLTKITHQAVAISVNALNNRPRKRLKYLTPKEMFDPAAIALQT